MKLSKNFTLSEFTRTSTGIHQVPCAPMIDNIKWGVEKILQPLRDALGARVIVSSGYRCPVVNSKVGGVENSQHLMGEAADIIVPDGLWSKAADILSANPYVDQLLSGRGYFHVSWIRQRSPRRFIDLRYYV